MDHLMDELPAGDEPSPPLPETEAARLADAVLRPLMGMDIYPRSITGVGGALYCLGRRSGRKMLGIVAKDRLPAGFVGQRSPATVGTTAVALLTGPADAANAAALRSRMAFLNPRPLGLGKSAGCGDRLGLATPGHVRAVAKRDDLQPIFAQQSVRENARTGRTPQNVMDDAVWGVFQEGWRRGFGADADHLKTPADLDAFAAAGFTFFTIDPGDHVDNAADTDAPETIRDKLDRLPWEALESRPAELLQRYTARPIDLPDAGVALAEADVARAAAKYGRVIAHTLAMYRHLATVMGARPFEMEMSVDETETVTRLAEHITIAGELRRLGVRWVSLAPRYVGDFEKGVDYIGDLKAFEDSFARHAAVARAFGPYKLSLHSGSDKFRIYPAAARLAGNRIHLKTAGTSYLEALRTVAVRAPALFRRIAAFAGERYPADRASYHVSARVDRMADAAALGDERLPEMLDEFHAREILHVTYGSVLNEPGLREAFFDCLQAHESDYTAFVERHFDRHFAALAA